MKKGGGPSLRKDSCILVVDDFTDVRQILKLCLLELGFHNVREAANGAEALRFLQSNPEVQLVISDWNMPEMSGRELLEQTRSFFKTKGVPFLMMTGDPEAQSSRAQRPHGVSGFLAKPFSPETLKAKIDEIFE